MHLPEQEKVENRKIHENPPESFLAIKMGWDGRHCYYIGLPEYECIDSSNAKDASGKWRFKSV